MSPYAVIIAVLLVTACTSNIPLWSPTAVTYFVSLDGDDSANGKTPAKAWRTIAKVNTMSFKPGDRILFQGGQKFVGGLAFGPDDRGRPDYPIVIGSYDDGRAIIEAGAQTALYAYNTAGFRIEDINFTGSGRSSNRADGISFYNDLNGNVQLSFIHIRSVDVSGFGQDGITIGAGNGSSGFRNIRIVHAVVHDNGRNGIGLYGQQRYANEDVYVGRCIAFGNSGIPGVEQNSGSGIILGSVNGGVIERSIAHSNGYLADAQEGPVGIWTYESNNIIIQHNTSYGNRTAATADGGGFDLDGGVTNSVLQYNLSFENDGAGYGLYQFPSASEWRNNVIRGNVSYNDGRKNDYGAITLWSGGSPLGAMEISDNHIVMSPAPSGKPSAITFYTTVEKAIFKSNTLIVSGDVDFVTHRKPTEPAVQGFPPAVGGPVFQDNVFLRVRGQSYFRGCASTEGHWQHC